MRAADAPDAVVGRRPALEAVRSGAARLLLVARSARPSSGLRELVEAAQAAGVPVERTDPERIDRLAGRIRHQGVAALVAAPKALGEGDLARRAWPPHAVALVLDGVTDPQNVGATARTAEAAGAVALVVRRPRGATITPAAVKASAGALLHLPVFRVANVPRALKRLKEAGFWVVGLDASAPTSVYDASPPSGPVALVAGSEGEGLSRLAREACDELVAIPLRGRVGSLNVSVAAGVGLFAYVLREKGGGGHGGRT